MSGSAGWATAVWLEASTAAADVQITWVSGTSPSIGLLARVVDASNYLMGQITGTNLFMWKRVSGTFTQIGSTYTGTQSTGTVYKLTASGNSLALFQNGVSRVTGTDATHNTATKWGFVENNGNSLRYDDFSVTDTAGGGGGENLTVSFVDASSGADLLNAAAAFAANLVDAAAGSDTSNAGASLSATLLDGVTAADIQSAVATLLASLVDGSTADDMLTATRIAAAAVIDAAAGDDINTTGTTFNRSLVDGASGADALQAAAIMVASLVDQAHLADQFNAAQQLVVLLTDAAAGSDLRSGSVPITANVSLIDLAAALDVLTATMAAAGIFTAASRHRLGPLMLQAAASRVGGPVLRAPSGRVGPHNL